MEGDICIILALSLSQLQQSNVYTFKLTEDWFTLLQTTGCFQKDISKKIMESNPIWILGSYIQQWKIVSLMPTLRKTVVFIAYIVILHET